MMDNGIICSVSFDIPFIYSEFAINGWKNEVAECKSASISNSDMMRKIEKFETLDAFLKQSRTFVTSQRILDVVNEV